MRIKVKNSMWERRHVYQFYVPEFNEYEGDEIAVKWLLPSQLALTTSDPKFPFRVIERKYIVSVDSDSYRYEEAKPKTQVVKGSKGNEYVVTIGKTNHCTCPGFGFRRTCKHIGQLQAA